MSIEDVLNRFDPIEPQAPLDTTEPQTDPFAETVRSTIPSGLSLLGRAAISAGETVENSLEFFGLNDSAVDTVSKLRQIDFFKPDLDEFLGRGFLQETPLGSIPSAFESLGPSLLAGGTGAAIGTAVAPGAGTLLGGLLGASASMLGLMGTAAYQQTYENEIARGVPEESARDTAFKVGVIEGAGEGAAALIPLAGLGKLAGNPLKKTLRNLLKIGPKQMALDFGKVYTGEQLTEFLQNTAQNKVLMDAGHSMESVLEGNLKTVIPTLFMTGSFQLGTKILNGRQKQELVAGLSEENPKELRQLYSDVIHKQLLKEDPGIATSWKQLADTKIQAEQPIDINQEFGQALDQLEQQDPQGSPTEVIETKAQDFQEQIDTDGDYDKAIEDLLDLKEPAATIPGLQKFIETPLKEREAPIRRTAGIEEQQRAFIEEGKQKEPARKLEAVKLKAKRLRAEKLLTPLAITNPENIEIVEQLEEIEASQDLLQDQKDQLSELLVDQAEQNTLEREPMPAQRRLELAKKSLQGTISQREQQELSFEIQRLKAQEPQEQKEDLKPPEEVPGVVTPKAVDVVRELQEQGEPVESRKEITTRKEGDIEFQVEAETGGDTTIASGSSVKSDQKFLLVRGEDGKWSVSVDGKLEELGLKDLKAAKLKANDLLVLKEGAAKREVTKGKGKKPKALRTTVGSMVAEPIDPDKPKSRWKVLDKGTGRELKSTGLRTAAEAERWMQKQQSQEVQKKQVQAQKKPKESVKKPVEPKEVPKEKKKVSLRRRKGEETVRRETIINDKGQAYILEDLVNSTYKTGMKIGEFSRKLRDTLGKAYNKIVGRIKELFKKAQAHLEKVTTGVERGQVVVRQEPKGLLEKPVEPEVTKEAPVEEPLKKRRDNLQKASTDTGTPVEKAWKGLGAFGRDVKKHSLKAFEVTSETLRRISPTWMHKLRRYEFDVTRNVKRHMESVKPFIDKLDTLSDTDRNDLWYALYNPAKMSEESARIIKDNKLQKEFKKVQEVLKELEDRADKTGILISRVKNYFPRHVKDYEGLMSFFDEQAKVDDTFKRELKEAEAQAEAKGADLSPSEKQELVASFITTGLYSKVPNPGSVKLRSLPHVPSRAMQYYSSLSDSLVTHIFEMNEKVGAFETAGKSGRKKFIKELRKLETQLEEDPKNQELLDRFEKIKGKIKTVEDAMDDSLAGMLEKDKTLTKGQAQLVASLFKQRFTQRGSRGAVQTLKNVGLGLMLGNPLSAITQLGDQAFNIYQHNTKAVGGMVEALKNKEFTKEFNFDSQHREFSNDSQSRMLDKLFTFTKLKAFDLYGKESFMKASFKKWQGSSLEEFEKKFGKSGEVFKDTKEVHKAFQEGGKNPDGSFNEDVLYALYSDLADFQPINLSETPEYYLKSGNLRILYMLKTFALKAVNSIVRETATEFRKGNYRQAGKNFFSLTALLGLAGASTDEIKDFILGREAEFLSDHVVDNLVALALMSRFDIEKGLREGSLIHTVASGALPPFGYIEDVLQDTQNLITGDDKTFKTLRNVPVVGRIAFERVSETGEQAKLKRRRRRILDDIREGKPIGGVRKRINEFNRRARKQKGIDLITHSSIKATKRRAKEKEIEEKAA
jgi:hypothetical protein